AGVFHEAGALGLVGEVEVGGQRHLVDGVGGAAAAQEVDGAVARDDRQPSAERAPRGGKRRRAAPYLHQDFLHDVLGRGGVAQHAQGDGKYQPRIAIVERCHGRLLARVHAREQQRIVFGDGGGRVHGSGLTVHRTGSNGVWIALRVGKCEFKCTGFGEGSRSGLVWST